MRTLLVLISVLSCGAANLHAQDRLALDYPALARKIVEQLAPEPGEKVILLAHPGVFRDMLPHLRYELMKSGAVDLGVLDVLPFLPLESWDRNVVARGFEPSRQAYQAMLQEVDAAVILPGVGFGPAYAALQDRLRQGQGRTVHFHWLEGGGSLALPGQPLPFRFVMDSTYQHAVLNTDYEALARLQEQFEQALRRDEVRVTTPLGTDVRFRVGDRPVNRQDGDASAARAQSGVILIDREIELPAGAVRVAPLEETVSGVIAFPPSQWDGQPVVGLKLRFESGRVIQVSADSGEELVEAEMQRGGEAARRFREFALGFNPEMAVPERYPWIPYYGYGAGVVRLSLGDNSELGGTVTGGYVRWNFFTDATVTVGNQVWVRDGKLVVR
ncbi:MAG: aminopeptidase [Gemmatimonadales bacterium]|nr:aminopeptidase [Gemmatimonadales bacterium]NIN11187.1 aminopeptidase [Gemmatimonadales bacterium]NIN49786.1 aminopeptidase [Gemmatimonadales bacterium]NIP07250.1 aminopeptidase [Gemmatimonadales bacterium]NIR00463.1 aminopeptidase [Gemmatimonadales bacterium]